MFPSEMVILMAIAVGKDTGKELLTRPMDVTGEYVGYLYNSLVNLDYLRGSKLTGYRLTSKGRETLLAFLQENGTRATDTLRRLQQLGIDIGQGAEQKVNKIEREAIKVN